MKSICILFIAFTFFIVKGYTQNWKLVNSKETFNYSSNSSEKIPYSIWVDSLEKKETDSVFYLNRYIFPCTGCSLPVADYCYKSSFNKVLLKDQGLFLQKKVIRNNDGVYRFYGKDTFAINSIAQVNENWTFDTTHSIIATLTKLASEEILGETDEVKTIVLSTDDTIKLSQNHGIVYFTSHSNNTCWKLSGIEERKLGISTPKAKDFFNFQVGDIFEYHLEINSWTGFTDVIEKYEIKSRTINGDTTKYQITGNRKQTTNSANPQYETINRTITFIDSSKHFLNKRYPRATVTDDCIFNYDEFTTDNDGLIYFSKGKKATAYQQIPNSDTILSYDLMPLDNFGTVYVVGLGMTYKQEPINDAGYISELVAYRKGNDTVGTFTETSNLTSILIVCNNKLSFYPNPCSDKVRLNINKSSNMQLSITDLSGRVIKTETLNQDSEEMDTSMIPSGIYIIELKNSTTSYSGLLRIDR